MTTTVSHGTVYVDGKKACSRCAKPRDTRGTYCRSCRAEYMRDWRADHKITKEEWGLVLEMRRE